MVILMYIGPLPLTGESIPMPQVRGMGLVLGHSGSQIGSQLIGQNALYFYFIPVMDKLFLKFKCSFLY